MATITPAGKARATPELRDRARALADQGHTKKEILEELNVHESTLARWLPATRDEKRREAMEALRDQGATYETIGARFGITRQAVAQILGPRRKAERGIRRNINLGADRWDGLRAAAKALGLIYADGTKEGRGSIILLLDAIGRGDARVEWNGGARGLGEPE
jgi:DNA invertase Pin-like site-specific DNA recombinase